MFQTVSYCSRDIFQDDLVRSGLHFRRTAQWCDLKVTRYNIYPSNAKFVVYDAMTFVGFCH